MRNKFILNLYFNYIFNKFYRSKNKLNKLHSVYFEKEITKIVITTEIKGLSFPS